MIDLSISLETEGQNLVDTTRSPPHPFHTDARRLWKIDLGSWQNGIRALYSLGMPRKWGRLTCFNKNSLGDSTMKTLSILIVAILFGFSGAAMAGDSGEAHQDNTNATGSVSPNSVGKCWTNIGSANYRWDDCPGGARARNQ